MAPLTLYADFNNADAEGRVRLNGAGTLSDLARLGVRLRDGLPLTIHDEGLAADGEVVYSPSEGVWTARIDWSLVRPWDAEPAAAGADANPATGP
ncbi:MAG: hypothetical protein K2X87_25040 [Gemmataceae bacterium]|nr:hypothetical protein [Gemmataceae bacterium]